MSAARFAVEADEASTGGADDARLTQVANIISSATQWSAATGAIPVPVLDLAALAAVQTRMLMDISEVYGQSFGKDAAKAFVSVSLGTLLPGVAAGAVFGSSLKLGLGLGSILGAASMAAFGAAATYAVGKVFAKHLHSGGSTSNFSPEAIKNNLKAEFDAAKAKPAK
jgi:uncharacterized protein (DUF697 family)